MKNLFKKVSAILMAAIMVLGMAASVFAAIPSESDTAEAVVHNVEAGATVTAYQITKAQYDKSGNGFIGYETVNKDVALGNVLAPTQIEVANIVKNGTLLATLPSTSMTAAGTEGLVDYKAQLAPGYWIVLVTGTVNEVYNPMLLGVAYSASGSDNTMTAGPVNADGNWALGGEAYAKSTQPSIEKKITGSTTADGTDTKDEPYVENGNDVAIGDIVNYEITTHIPSYSKQYTKVILKIKDTLSKGLTLDPDSIKINGAAVDSEMGKLTINADGFEFEIDSNYALAHGNEEIKVTYSATVNNQAEKNFDPNTNTAKLVYSNNPADEDDTKETESTTYTYTFSIGAALSASIQDYNKKINQIIKVDADGKVISTSKTESGLEADKVIEVKEGAEFTLTNKKTGKVYTATTGVDGGLTFEGLDAGEYTLVETKAPSGFTLNTRQIPVVISATYTTEGKLDTLTIKIDGENTSTYKATYDTTGTIKTITETTTVTDVINTKIAQLPSTGGMGTYLFTIIGVVVMAGAAGAFFMSRRRGSEE